MAESKFREMAKKDLPMLQAELGDPTAATLTPSGGAPVEITVIVSEVQGIGDVGGDGNQIGHRRSWLLDQDDLPNPQAKYDTIKTGGMVYTLDNHEKEGSFIRCEFTATEKTQFSSEKLHAQT